MTEPKKAAAAKESAAKAIKKAAKKTAVPENESRRDYVARLADDYGWVRTVHDDCDVYRYPRPRPVQVDNIAICWTPDPEDQGNWRMVTLDGHRDMATNNLGSLAYMFGDAFGDPGGINRFGLEYLCNRGVALVGEYAGMHPAQAWQKWLDSDEYHTHRAMRDAIGIEEQEDIKK